MNYALSLASVLLLAISSTVFLLQQVIYYLGIKRGKYVDNAPKENLGTPLISVVVPVKNEPLELIEELIRNVNSLNYPKDRLELIIVSDDEPPYSDEVKSKVNELAKEVDFNIKVFIRDKPIGSKAGALAYGVLRARGDYVLIIDVDSKLSSNAINEGIKCMEQGYDACVYRWLPYLFFPTKIACAVCKSMYYVVDTLYSGRSRWGFFVFPLGSGTLFRKEALKDVGLWDYDIIQDDMWIGVKFMNKGKRIKYLDNEGIRVSVPSTYTSIRTQQLRWAYGVAQVLRKGLRMIVKSKLGLLKKIEAIFFLSQYVPTIFLSLGQGLLLLALFIDKIDPMYKFFYINIVPFIAAAAYVYQFMDSLRRRGYKFFNALRSLGTNASVVATMIPALALNTLKGFLNVREVYKRTPKGVQELLHKNVSPYEVSYLAFAVFAFTFALTHNFIFTAMFYALITAAILYTLIRSGMRIKECKLLQ
ncbi:MAG: hypothetical protein DRO18_05145 [Thermoprotei archaeon]|nr:MAG: hypothetical protein DRO18_05145 [Thermoprotei archaeon]